MIEHYDPSEEDEEEFEEELDFSNHSRFSDDPNTERFTDFDVAYFWA